jgi:hypothetical protein
LSLMSKYVPLLPDNTFLSTSGQSGGLRSSRNFYSTLKRLLLRLATQMLTLVANQCWVYPHFRLTGNPNLTPLLPTHIVRSGPKSDRSY